MPYNEKSLQNLSKGGSRPGQRKRLTVSLVKDMTDSLTGSFSEFRERMANLDDKDYCDVYLKLMKLLLPKNLSIELDTPKPAPAIDWTIRVATDEDIENYRSGH